MLQIYDRVITSRSESTLMALTILAAFLICVYAVLEMLRSRLLVRAGLAFDQEIAEPVFHAVHRGNLILPGGNHVQCLRDVDTLREFLTGAGLIALCDAPWFPVFVFAAFLLHPVFGYLALAGSAIILGLTFLNEKVTQTSARRRRLGVDEGQSERPVDVSQYGSVAGDGDAYGDQEVMDEVSRRNPFPPGSGQRPCGPHRGLDEVYSHVHADRHPRRRRLPRHSARTFAGRHDRRVHSDRSRHAADRSCGRQLERIHAARSAFGRLRHLFTIAGAEDERMSLPRPHGALQVSELIASAPGPNNPPILKSVTFNLAVGEIIGVIGPSAAGKSSLARVLVGVWPALRGSVRLDGSDLSHWNPEELGRYIGYLPQDIELFAGTIAQNIARFQNVDTEQVIFAARLAGCHEMIQHLPKGYNTPIGEGGQALSGGQRQRVGLARALYGKPSVVVLDEPNANLDAAGEEALLAAIQNLKAMKTTVVIVTHKINILAAVDKILIMADGAVQAFGEREVILQRLIGPRVVASTPTPNSV